MHHVNTVEEVLPVSERYIHTVVTKGEIRLVVTMHPQIVKHIHSVRFLAIDYTFKQVHGDMNEWEVAGNLDRYKTHKNFYLFTLNIIYLFVLDRCYICEPVLQ